MAYTQISDAYKDALDNGIREDRRNHGTAGHGHRGDVYPRNQPAIRYEVDRVIGAAANGGLPGNTRGRYLALKDTPKWGNAELSRMEINTGINTNSTHTAELQKGLWLVEPVFTIARVRTTQSATSLRSFLYESISDGTHGDHSLVYERRTLNVPIANITFDLGDVTLQESKIVEADEIEAMRGQYTTQVGRSFNLYHEDEDNPLEFEILATLEAYSIGLLTGDLTVAIGGEVAFSWLGPELP